MEEKKEEEDSLQWMGGVGGFITTDLASVPVKNTQSNSTGTLVRVILSGNKDAQYLQRKRHGGSLHPPIITDDCTCHIPLPLLYFPG